MHDQPGDPDRAATATVAVVLAGGGPVGGAALAAAGGVPAGARVIAADAGAELAAGLGLTVDDVVGDLDSIAPATLAALRAGGARVERHPAAKDATDLDLALATAAAGDATDVLVLGGAGGRLDHLLGGTLLLADARWAAMRVAAVLGDARLHVVHGPGAVTVAARRGELLSILPVGGAAESVTTGGLRYPLDAATLEPGTTRGISNVVDDPGGVATIALEAGTVLVVVPGELHVEDPATTDPGVDR